MSNPHHPGRRRPATLVLESNLPADCRTAVYGGDARQQRAWARAGAVRFFHSRCGGGNGELRRLVAAVRARAVDRVIVLWCWNKHAAARKIRRACRRYGVECVPAPRRGRRGTTRGRRV